jgi:hypothetical protein
MLRRLLPAHDSTAEKQRAAAVYRAKRSAFLALVPSKPSLA